MQECIGSCVAMGYRSKKQEQVLICWGFYVIKISTLWCAIDAVAIGIIDPAGLKPLIAGLGLLVLFNSVVPILAQTVKSITHRSQTLVWYIVYTVHRNPHSQPSCKT